MNRLKEHVLVVIVIVLVCAVVVFNLDNETHLDLESGIQPEVVLNEANMAHNQNSLQQSTNTLEQTEPTVNYQASKSLRSTVRSFCGINEGGIDQSVSSFFRSTGGKQPETLAKKQIDAIDQIYQKCGGWYDFVSNHDEYKDQELTNREKELDRVFSINNYNEENIAYARELLASENSRLSSVALVVLLSRDKDFQYAVANSVGSHDRNYALNAMLPLFMKYACTLEKDCSAGSLTMLTACSADDSICGLSIDQYLYSQHSPQYVADILGMSHGILKIINDN